jgi:hypothetical protein
MQKIFAAISGSALVFFRFPIPSFSFFSLYNASWVFYCSILFENEKTAITKRLLKTETLQEYNLYYFLSFFMEHVNRFFSPLLHVR